MDVSYTQLDETLPAPAYVHPGDAGLDLRAAVGGTLEPFERRLVPCGFALAIPDGYAGLVIPRSGLAAKHGISIVNAPGLIDSGYRGEIMVSLINLDGKQAFTFEKGDRIAQLMIIRTVDITLHNTSELPESDRGARGFGSSGVH
ncbi:dUTP diphosphatase [uncultured Adlercreutzia sp.]|uniref:dUTP diphosphatase n=1 Tax=uncultured Adlercreutzia sp. TaxID=875803 RepID=UPI0025E4E992|nr:dUTP diphosphatase [uncultured Adlercreutzia sp.]